MWLGPESEKENSGKAMERVSKIEKEVFSRNVVHLGGLGPKDLPEGIDELALQVLGMTISEGDLNSFVRLLHWPW